MQQRASGNEKTEPGRCLTGHISENFSSCLAEGRRNRCNYAFLFGDDYLCTHPKHRDFK